MALIAWTDTYSIGVPAIDTQHKRLFELVNELHDAMARGSANQLMDGVLARLIDYTRAHFSGEERLMRNAGYPNLAGHKAEHDKLTSEAAGLQDRFRAGKLGISIEVLWFLRDWLHSHIMGSDKEIGRHLARKAAS